MKGNKSNNDSSREDVEAGVERRRDTICGISTDNFR